jgi:hypothetical protein
MTCSLKPKIYDFDFLNKGDDLIYMKKIARIFVQFFLIAVTAACGNTGVKTSCASLLPDIPQGELNRSLSISVPQDMNTFKIGNIVELVGEDHLTSPIEVVPDKDLKIFQWMGNSWSEVKNQINYSSRIEHISLPTADDPGIGVFELLFTLSPQFMPVQTCIILRGIKDPDSSRVNVAAYVEFTMHP